jgi:hypothetical protein
MLGIRMQRMREIMMETMMETMRDFQKSEFQRRKVHKYFNRFDCIVGKNRYTSSISCIFINQVNDIIQ